MGTIELEATPRRQSLPAQLERFESTARDGAAERKA
jgi:hypothetical protein